MTRRISFLRLRIISGTIVIMLLRRYACREKQKLFDYMQLYALLKQSQSESLLLQRISFARRALLTVM